MLKFFDLERIEAKKRAVVERTKDFDADAQHLAHDGRLAGEQKA